MCFQSRCFHTYVGGVWTHLVWFLIYFLYPLLDFFQKELFSLFSLMFNRLVRIGSSERTLLIHLSASVHFPCKLPRSPGNQKTKTLRKNKEKTSWRRNGELSLERKRGRGRCWLDSQFTFDWSWNHFSIVFFFKKCLKKETLVFLWKFNLCN